MKVLALRIFSLVTPSTYPDTLLIRVNLPISNKGIVPLNYLLFPNIPCILTIRGFAVSSPIAGSNKVLYIIRNPLE